MSFTFVSIIIPVFNDSEHLKLCLEALENQTYPEEFYEVIVVDNNSTEDLFLVTQEFKKVRLTHEMRQGSYAARNTGVKISRGNLLGFTDSDCIPAVNWIEAGVNQFQSHENCGLVAGHIEFFFKRNTNPNGAEYWDSVNHLQQKKYVEKQKFGATANIFTSRAVFDCVGLFNPELQSGGDLEWGNRVFVAGYQQIYAADVCVQHPARASILELKTKLKRVTEGHYILRSTTKTLGQIFQDYLHLAKPTVRHMFRLLNSCQYDMSLKHKVEFVYVYIMLRHALAWEVLQRDLKNKNFPVVNFNRT